MKSSKSSGFFVSILLVLGVAAPAVGVPLDPPRVSLVAADRTSINLQVQAGASGAPGGFIVEWLPADQYRALGGWPASTASVFSAAFTGVPTLNPTPGLESFRLGPGESAEVVIGALFDETGVVASDHAELAENTEYALRVRAAAGGLGTHESPNSPTILHRTSPRGSTDCTLTQGYWKNHPDTWARVNSITLGFVTYDQAQLLAILRQPAGGNGLLSLAHQLIATRLNMLLGALPPASIVLAVGQADTVIGTLIVPPIGTGRLDPGLTSPLTETLDDFNTGAIGPGHCPDDTHVVPVVGQTWGTLKSIYR